MEDDKPKHATEDKQHDPGAGEGNVNTASTRTGTPTWSEQIGKYLAATISFARGRAGRLLLTLAGVFFGALILLWVVDKVVFYYLARTYIDEVADVFDLNQHLANALILFTFAVALLFGRYVWSFSKRKRLVGLGGISALLVVHSLVLWYGTRSQYFDRSGKAIKCYVLTRDGKVSYGERPGVDPASGRLCRPLTPEMLERLTEYAKGKRPQQIIATSLTFFDPRTGEPIIWFYRTKNNTIELFDLMGFEPDTGDELLPVTKKVVEEWKAQSAQESRCVPKRISPGNFVFFDPLNGKSRAWYWQDANGNYEFYDCSGFQPQTGDKLRVVTREIVDAWKNVSNKQEHAPQLVDPNTFAFFDPTTGAPRVWYWRSEDGRYEFYNAPGFQPRTGDKLQIVTKDVIETWKRERERKTQEIDAEKKKADEAATVGERADALSKRAAEFVNILSSLTSGPKDDLMAAADNIYADQVIYFGKAHSRQEIEAALERFMERWPTRQYTIKQNSFAINCDGATLVCDVKGLLDFDDSSPARNSRSWGTASFEYVLKFSSITGAPRVVEESGDVKTRHLEPLSSMPNAPPGYPVQQNPMTREQMNQMMQGIFGTFIQHMGR